MAISPSINDALLNDLFVMYSKTEADILAKVTKASAKGAVSDSLLKKQKDTQEMMADITAMMNNKTKYAKTKVGGAIISAYKHGVNSAEADANSKKTIMSELHIPMSVQNLILATNKLLDDSNQQVLRSVDDTYREIQAQAATGVLMGTETRIQATQGMLNAMLAQGITSFMDTAGRKWNLASYAEMCVRTVTAQAARQGHLDRAVELSNDLIKISRIGTTCPICQRWQGVVLSITGKTPGYMTVDDARAAGVFHPNCRHTMASHIPELDGPGQTQLNPENPANNARNKLLMKQRSNERKIRHYKQAATVAITKADKDKAIKKAREWSAYNKKFCEDNNLRRMPAREGVMRAKGPVPEDMKLGGLKAYDPQPQTKPYSWLELWEMNTAELNAVYEQVVGYPPKGNISVTNKKNQIHSMQAGGASTPKAQPQPQPQPQPIPAPAPAPAPKAPKEKKPNPKLIASDKLDEIQQNDPYLFEQMLEDLLLQQVNSGKLTLNYKGTNGYMLKQEALAGDYSPFAKMKLFEKLQQVEPYKGKLHLPKKLTVNEQYAQKFETFKSDLQNNTSMTAAEATAQLKQHEADANNPDLNYHEQWLAKKKYKLVQKKDMELLKDKVEGDLSKVEFEISWINDHTGLISTFSEQAQKHVNNKKVMLESIKKDMEKQAKINAKLAAKPAKAKLTKAYKLGPLTEQERDEYAIDISSSIVSRYDKAGFELDKKLTLKAIKDVEKLTGKKLLTTAKLNSEIADAESKFTPGNYGSEPLTALHRQLREKIEDATTFKNGNLGEKSAYALYDYTVGSGAYNQTIRNNNRHQTASGSGHNSAGIGVSDNEYDYGNEMIGHLRRLFNEAEPVQEPFVVKRSVGKSALKSYFGFDDSAGSSEMRAFAKTANEAKGQAIFEEPAFSSCCTFSSGSWSGDIGMIIKVNPGAKAIYAQPFSNYQGGSEVETILDAGTKFRIIKVVQYGDSDYNDFSSKAGLGANTIMVCETV